MNNSWLFEQSLGVENWIWLTVVIIFFELLLTIIIIILRKLYADIKQKEIISEIAKERPNDLLYGAYKATDNTEIRVQESGLIIIDANKKSFLTAIDNELPKEKTMKIYSFGEKDEIVMTEKNGDYTLKRSNEPKYLTVDFVSKDLVKIGDKEFLAI